MSIYKWQCTDKEHAIWGYPGIIFYLLLITIF